MVKISKISLKNSLFYGAAFLIISSPSYSFAQEMDFDGEVQQQVDDNVSMDFSPTPDDLDSSQMDEDFDMPPMPEQIEVMDDVDVNQMAVVPTTVDENANIDTNNSSNVTNSGAAIVPHSGTYYDSSSFGSSSFSTAPREVDPRYEPGSRFVVVEKNAGASSFSSQLVSAQRALSLGRYTSALEMYENLYKRDSKNSRVLMGLAVAQQKSGFNESALATYEELLRREPNNTDALINMLGLITSGNPEQAYRKLSAMWEGNNRNPAIASQLGFTAAELGDLDMAIRYMGIAASMEPNNPNHYYNMGVISDRAGLTKQAIEFYQKSLDMGSSSSTFRNVSRDVIYDRLATLRRL